MNPPPALIYDDSDWHIQWFGVSQDGHIGCFESGGTRVHPFVKQSFAEQRSCDHFVKSLTICSEYVLDENALDYFSTYMGRSKAKKMLNRRWDFARRGLFVYCADIDAPDTNPPYRRALIPNQPIHIEMLPAEISKYLSNIVIPVRFSEALQIPQTLFFPE